MSTQGLSDQPTVHWRLEQWFPELVAEELEKLKRLHNDLIRFNRTLNLIGVKTIATADNIHFADSILASRKIAADLGEEKTIYDIGSGNGFPGLVFAILYPDIEVKLVEIDQRKSEYLKHCVSAIGLENRVDVLIRRAEDLPIESVQVAMCRGFSSLSKALLLLRKQFAVGGRFYHLKSEEWASEISQMPTQLCSYWHPSLLAEYKLPVGEIRYAVVKTEKIAK